MLCSFVNYAPGRRTTLRVLRYLIPISAWEVARNPYSRFRVRYAGEKSGLASNCRRGSRLREYRRFTKFVGQRTQRADVSHCAQLTSEAVSTGRAPDGLTEAGSDFARISPETGHKLIIRYSPIPLVVETLRRLVKFHTGVPC